MRNSYIVYPAGPYPGDYEPLPWKEKELENARQKKGAKIMKPPFSIQELRDHYCIELHVSGFGREDFSIHTNGFSLTIGAVRKNTMKKERPLKRSAIILRRSA